MRKVNSHGRGMECQGMPTLLRCMMMRVPITITRAEFAKLFPA